MSNLEQELIKCAEGGDIGGVKSVLGIDLVDVNYQTGDIGDTALIKAAYGNKGLSTEIVELLIDGGADVNLANYQGRTPLMVACLMNKPEIIKVLLERGANYAVKTSLGLTGQTAMMFARAGKCQEAIDVLERFIEAKEQFHSLSQFVNSEEQTRQLSF